MSNATYTHRSSSLCRATANRSYGLAILSVAATFLFVFWLDLPALFFTAILLSACYGGIGPGLFAAFLSILGRSFYLYPSDFGWGITNLKEAVYILIWSLTALCIAWLTARRIEIEEELRESEQRFRSYFELGLVGSAILTPGRDFMAVNDKFCEIFGYERSELLQMTCEKLINPDDLAADVADFNRILAGKIDGYSQERRFIRKDGLVMWSTFSLKCLRCADGSVNYFVAHLQDITERKLAELKIIAYQEQLRSMASEISFVEERERHKIATTLHDQIGQTLAMAKIKTGELRKSVLSPDEASQLKTIFKLIETAILDTRSIMSELSPPLLFALGFEAALEWYTEKIREQHGIRVKFEDDRQPKPLDENIQILLFSAVRELLVNAVKHSRAGLLKVALHRVGDSIRITVEDDGIGFDPSGNGLHYGNAGGFGLFSIRERLAHFGGELRIVSQIGNGTLVTLIAPLKGGKLSDSRSGLAR